MDNDIYTTNVHVQLEYNLLGQLVRSTDSLGSRTNYFNQQGLLIAVSNAFGREQTIEYDIHDHPVALTNANGVAITQTFDRMGRALTRSYPDNGVERFGYGPDGLTAYTNQLTNITIYAYDLFGRLINEVHGSASLSLATNQFAYSGAGDLLVLTDGNGHTTRWSKAKTNTVYEYDPVGNMTRVAYAHGTNVLAYDALNRLTNMVDATGTTRYGYDSAGQLTSEDGPWESDMVNYSYQISRKRQRMELRQPGSTWAQTYGYDAAQRLTNTVSSAGAFGYAYIGVGQETGPGRLINRLSLPNGTYVTNTFDGNGRMAGTWLKNSTNGMLNWHGYGYNEAGWRTSATNYITNHVTYAYDELGQLKTATGYESYGSQRIHENFSYEYDAAGNLKTRNANNFHRYFTVDNVNQLSSLTATGSVVVSGAVTGNPTNVTVNGVGATLYWDKTFGRAINSWADGSNTFTAIAQDSLGRHDTNTVTVYLPRSQNFVYDDNGNLVSDGRRDFEYDDENQLTRITLANAWKAEFTYDGKMRRRITKEYTWKNNAWSKTNELRYIYDGMLVIQERNALNLPVKTYTRGLDLSGSLQGAGDIGGLLAISCASATQPNSHCYYHADGNGNITALLNEKQIVVARYQYDPYGNPIAATGPMAEANIYRFSSKELHANSGLYYYGYRFYEPSLQRWMNQDPMGEGSCLNLYNYVENGPINFVDPLGLLKYSWDGQQMLVIYPPWWQFWKTQPVVYLVHPDLAKNILRDKGIEDAAVNAAVALAALELQKKFLKDQEQRQTPPANCPKPPGWNDQWNWGPPAGEKEGNWRWFDPAGGEWRRHEDPKHDPHWDYNPWRNPTDSWRNVDDNGQFVWPFKNYKK